MGDGAGSFWGEMMGKWEETKEVYEGPADGTGSCGDPCKMPLPEYCDICMHALEINPGCYYCMLNDRYI